MDDRSPEAGQGKVNEKRLNRNIDVAARGDLR